MSALSENNEGPLIITPEEEEELREALLAMTASTVQPLPPALPAKRYIDPASLQTELSGHVEQFMFPQPYLSWNGHDYPFAPEMKISHWNSPPDSTVSSYADWRPTTPVPASAEESHPSNYEEFAYSQGELDDILERVARRKDGQVTASNTPQPATPIKQHRLPSNGSIHLSPLLTHNTTLQRERTLSTPLLTSTPTKDRQKSLPSKLCYLFSDSEEDSEDDDSSDIERPDGPAASAKKTTQHSIFYRPTLTRSSFLQAAAQLKSTVASPDAPAREITLPRLSLTSSQTNDEGPARASEETAAVMTVYTPSLNDRCDQPTDLALRPLHVRGAGEIFSASTGKLSTESPHRDMSEEEDEINIILVDAKSFTAAGPSAPVRPYDRFTVSPSDRSTLHNWQQRLQALNHSGEETKQKTSTYATAYASTKQSASQIPNPTVQPEDQAGAHRPVPMTAGKIFLPRNVRHYQSVPREIRSSNSPFICDTSASNSRPARSEAPSNEAETKEDKVDMMRFVAQEAGLELQDTSPARTSNLHLLVNAMDLTVENRDQNLPSACASGSSWTSREGRTARQRGKGESVIESTPDKSITVACRSRPTRSATSSQNQTDTYHFGYREEVGHNMKSRTARSSTQTACLAPSRTVRAGRQSKIAGAEGSASATTRCSRRRKLTLEEEKPSIPDKEAVADTTFPSPFVRRKAAIRAEENWQHSPLEEPPSSKPLKDGGRKRSMDERSADPPSASKRTKTTNSEPPKRYSPEEVSIRYREKSGTFRGLMETLTAVHWLGIKNDIIRALVKSHRANSDKTSTKELLATVQQALIDAGFSKRSLDALKFRVRQSDTSRSCLLSTVQVAPDADVDEVETSIIKEEATDGEEEDDPLLLK
ncbi:hypothetical protein I317_06253 [Kwoniella heveanensis CBS 569]|nr:hypothetical protein I317_06253 [Kwoniella heveanensis CBS 569]